MRAIAEFHVAVKEEYYKPLLEELDKYFLYYISNTPHNKCKYYEIRAKIGFSSKKEACHCLLAIKEYIYTGLWSDDNDFYGRILTKNGNKLINSYNFYSTGLFKEEREIKSC